MAVSNTMNPLAWLRKHLDEADPDLLRSMLKVFFCDQLMSADADGLCNADYGERSPERLNVRNGYHAGTSTPGSGRSSSRSQSFELAPTTPTGS